LKIYIYLIYISLGNVATQLRCGGIGLQCGPNNKGEVAEVILFLCVIHFLL